MNHTSPPVTGGSPDPRVEFSAPVDPGVLGLRVVPAPRRERPVHDLPAVGATADYPDLDDVTPGLAPRLWRLPTTAGDGFTTVPDEPEPHGGHPGHADRTLVFRGRLIGMSTNRRPTHTGHAPGESAPTSARCTGCRWFETRVYRLNDDDSAALFGMRYVLHFVGRSTVPHELDLPRHELARGGHEVVEAYTMRKPGERPFITKPGARVLAQAANYDAVIQDAYVNRATA